MASYDVASTIHQSLVRGDTIASCDADGLLKLWDVRMVAELLSVDCGPHPVGPARYCRRHVPHVIIHTSPPHVVTDMAVENTTMCIDEHEHQSLLEEPLIQHFLSPPHLHCAASSQGGLCSTNGTT
jgi:hypothetical protein